VRCRPRVQARIGGIIVIAVIPSLSLYRIEPALVLGTIHRPWRDVLGVRGYSRWIRLRAFLLLLVVIGPSSVYRRPPQSRPPNSASLALFRTLERWDGTGPVPGEIQALSGQVIQLEGYVYVPYERAAPRWRSSFYLVARDPSAPRHVFHDEEPPGIAERVAIELVDPIEITEFPVLVTGPFSVGEKRMLPGEAVYSIRSARGVVIASELD